MKKISFLVLVSTLFSTNSYAAGQSDYSSWYAGIGINADIMKNNTVNGTSSGTLRYSNAFTIPDLVVGYRPESLYNETGDIRVELELLGLGAPLDKVTVNGITTKGSGSLDVGSLLANGYYDFHTSTSFTPFVGAGLGIADARFTKNPGFGITNKTSSNNDLAYHLTVGVSYVPQIWPHTDWSIAYDYLGTGDPEFSTSTGHVKLNDVSINAIDLAFKYHF